MKLSILKVNIIGALKYFEILVQAYKLILMYYMVKCGMCVCVFTLNIYTIVQAWPHKTPEAVAT